MQYEYLYYYKFLIIITNYDWLIVMWLLGHVGNHFHLIINICLQVYVLKYYCCEQRRMSVTACHSLITYSYSIYLRTLYNTMYNKFSCIHDLIVFIFQIACILFVLSNVTIKNFANLFHVLDNLFREAPYANVKKLIQVCISFAVEYLV